MANVQNSLCTLKVYLNQGDFEDDKDDYVVPGDLNVVFS